VNLSGGIAVHRRQAGRWTREAAGSNGTQVLNFIGQGEEEEATHEQEEETDDHQWPVVVAVTEWE
jgi:hypothetical protein